MPYVVSTATRDHRFCSTIRNGDGVPVLNPRGAIIIKGGANHQQLLYQTGTVTGHIISGVATEVTNEQVGQLQNEFAFVRGLQSGHFAVVEAASEEKALKEVRNMAARDGSAPLTDGDIVSIAEDLAHEQGLPDMEIKKLVITPDVAGKPETLDPKTKTGRKV